MNVDKTLRLGAALASVLVLGTAFVAPAHAVPFGDRQILIEDNVIGTNPDSLSRFLDLGDLSTNSFYADQLQVGGIGDGERLFPNANCNGGSCSGSNDPTVGPIATEPALGSPEFDAFFSSPSTFGASATDFSGTWTVNHEVALVYEFNIDVPLWTEVELHIGVDNGAYVWIDGNYLWGALQGGGAPLDEYTAFLPDMTGGPHVMQVLLEDHGGSTGYNIELRGTPAGVPEPGALALFGMGLLGLAAARRRRTTR